MKRKLFAFDLDGTLFQKNETINCTTLAAIQYASEQGHIVVTNTGRGPHKSWMDRLLPNASDFDYLIYNNGSMYTNTHKNENVFFGDITLEVIKSVVNKVKESFEVYFMLQTDYDVYCLKMWDLKNPPQWTLNERVVEIMSHYNNVVDEKTFFEKAISDKVLQLTFMSVPENLNNIQPVIKEFLGDKLTVHKVGGNYIDITINNVNKFLSLEKIRKIENIEMNDVYVFGDSGNDYEMIKGYKNSYCMGNGSPVIKEIASEIIGDNSSDTIGKKILEILNVK